MTFVKSTTMSTRRIVISFLLFLLIPVIRIILGHMIGSDTLAMMFALNLVVTILIIYDWELFALHWNRMKQNVNDTILFTVIGTAFIFFWTLFNSNYLSGVMVLPDASIFTSFPVSIPVVMFAFSISLAVIVNMEFKCVTDHLKIHTREIFMILLSGFAFGLVFTILMTPFRFAAFLQTYIYHVVLISYLSYSYNQTHSFLPGIMSMAAVYFAWQILFMI